MHGMFFWGQAAHEQAFLKLEAEYLICDLGLKGRMADAAERDNAVAGRGLLYEKDQGTGC